MENTNLNVHLNELKNKIVMAINDSKLPVGIVYYIVKDIYREIETVYENAVLSEMNPNNVSQKTDEDTSEE